jgi:hypothetical protein
MEVKIFRHDNLIQINAEDKFYLRIIHEYRQTENTCRGAQCAPLLTLYLLMSLRWLIRNILVTSEGFYDTLDILVN